MAEAPRRPEGRRPQGQKYPRLPLCVPATVTLLDRRGAPLAGESRNLSQGGIQLRLPRRLAPGTRLQVTLQMQEHAPLTLPGRVIWSRPHPDRPGWAVGVQFTAPLPASRFLALVAAEEPAGEWLPWLAVLGVPVA
jgi:hypothetical protein